MLYLASAPLGILATYGTGLRESDLLVGAGQKFVLAYTSVGITLNFLVSTLICVRIFLLTKHLKAALGEGAAHVYTNTAAVIIESALPYTLAGIVYVVVLGMHSSTTMLFMSVYVLFTVRLFLHLPQ